MKKYLGIDYGARRIGLAVGNDEAKIAQPLKTLVTDKGYWDDLVAVIGEQEISELVVGLPRNLNGDDTAQTREVRFFAAELASLKLPIHLQDEAGTTDAAKQLDGAKTDLDALAAMIILQDYLESL